MKKEEVIRYFNELVNQQPPEIKDWIIEVNKLLIDKGCKISANDKGVFTYTSSKTNLKVCVIHMDIERCEVFPYGRHFAYDDNILTHLPESMLGVLTE